LGRCRRLFYFQLPLLPEATLRAGNYGFVRAALRGGVRRGSFTPADVERYVEAISRPGALSAAINYYRALFRQGRGAMRQVRRVDAPVPVICCSSSCTGKLVITLTASGSTTALQQTLVESAAALRPAVREFQDETERERRIPPPLVNQLREAGLYRMLTPRQLGGLQTDLLTCFRVVELIAEADGSVGWNLTNNAIQHVAVLSLPDAGVEEIFARGPDQIIAGTLVPGGGTGVRVEGGYQVTGRWRFGSGCRESQWMMANFALLEGDTPRVNADGTRDVIRVVFRSDECEVIDTWDMSGMRGTGSHDWTVTNVFVPERRTVLVPGGVLRNQWRERWSGTLYALPTHCMVGPHHSMMATGIARAGIDALVELAGGKVPRGRIGLLRDQPQVQDWVARAEGLLGGGRAFREAVLREVWETVESGHPTTLEQRARCRLAGSHAVDCARQAMDLVYRAGGTTSTERTHRLAHCWRDLQVVSQAASVAPEWYPLAGRALLGLDPGPRLT
jgi:indole-3-acetate monooxygenase